MKSTKKTWLIAFLLIFALLISSCNLQSVAEAEAGADGAADAGADAGEIDPEAIFTSAAGTVAAQLTETAISFSPTPEPATATVTPIPPTATLVDLNATPTTAGFLEATSTLAPGVPSFTPGAPTLFPTATQQSVATQSGAICDAMSYGSPLDVTIPDGTDMKPGQDFEKIWRVYNDGVCTWDDGYILVSAGTSSPRPDDNNPLDAPNPAWKLKTLVAPGGVVDIGINLTAPLDVGEGYQNCFILQNDRGVNFGGVLCVIIDVVK